MLDSTATYGAGWLLAWRYWGLLFLVRWLMPADHTFGWWVGFVALFGLPYGGLIWAFWRANKAGKRFLAQWKGEQDAGQPDRLDGTGFDR